MLEGVKLATEEEIKDLKSKMMRLNILGDFLHIFDNKEIKLLDIPQDGLGKYFNIIVRDIATMNTEVVNIFEVDDEVYIQECSVDGLSRIVTKYKDGEIHSKYGVIYHRNTVHPKEEVYYRYEGSQVIKIAKDRAVSTIDVYTPENDGEIDRLKSHQKCVISDKKVCSSVERTVTITKDNMMNESIEEQIMYIENRKGKKNDLDFKFNYFSNNINNRINATIQNTVNKTGHSSSDNFSSVGGVILRAESVSPITYKSETKDNVNGDKYTMIEVVPNVNISDGLYKSYANSNIIRMTASLKKGRHKNRTVNKIDKIDCCYVELPFETDNTAERGLHRYPKLLPMVPKICREMKENLGACNHTNNLVTLMEFAEGEVNSVLNNRQKCIEEENGQNNTALGVLGKASTFPQGQKIGVLDIARIGSLREVVDELDEVKNLAGSCMLEPIISRQDLKVAIETPETAVIEL
ncbi:MAG TPA: hypothetical protein DEP72_01305 [Clostridiales bacterium]|nr:MAG: hypothetical protein A2Y18_05680 [Clostridiales bacterium GWD2_32_19]HCC06790.1 hypothetical protein [Clostridiales bacterium]